MHLWARRTHRGGRWYVGVVILAVAGWFIFGQAVSAGAADTWTITFTAGPLPCSSRPDVAGLTILPGTSITLVNRIGSAATVDLGVPAQSRLDDGDAVSVRLSTGERTVRLVPECPGIGDVIPSAVHVVPGAALEGPDPTSTVHPSGLVLPSRTPGSSAGTPLAEAGPGAASTVSGQPAGPGATGTSASSPSAEAGDPSAAAVADSGLGTDVFGPGYRLFDDHPGVGLLGVVALICILGVVVGIIRAIRAQHGTRAAGRFT